MHAQAFNDVPEIGSKQYLKAEVFPRKRNHLSCFYIGKDNSSIALLSSIFESCICAEDLNDARRLLRKAEVGVPADVFILDTTFSSSELEKFRSYLASTGVYNKLPILFNEQINRNSEAVRNYDLFDDIIDLSKLRTDLSGKISFLKKTKEYSFSVVKPVRVRPSVNYVKRAFDIILSALGLIILSPLFLLIAIAIKLESKGPVFYNAKRAGRGFRIFRFHKFRTMEVNADKKIDKLSHLNQYHGSGDGPVFFKITNDPRITRIGKFLRNTSLDELPQLFNVLKGDMSLVGIRPLPLYEAATLTTNEFVERFMAPAGITGLWQIKKRGNADLSVEERISLDISYARKNSMMYDLWIMAHTPAALIQKTNV